MFTVQKEDMHRFRGGGGEPFTTLMDSLIYAESLFMGIPASRIMTNMRTSTPDGGVDTKIDVSGESDATGYFKTKTVWQFKGTAKSSITFPKISAELQKHFLLDCINNNYGYRLCVCDFFTAAAQTKMQEYLNQEIKKINPQAPEALVLSFGDIAKRLEVYPAQIFRFLRKELHGEISDIGTALTSIRSVTKHYVDNPAWSNIVKEINEHLNFTKAIINPILLIDGKAGVGKTRMVMESIGTNFQIYNIAAYSSDSEFVVKICRGLVTDPSVKAVIVADECSLQSRMDITNIIQGHSNRIRVIAIDNQGQFTDGLPAKYFLEKIPQNVLAEILRQNFPEVPENIRRTYCDISEGFVRLAADLCLNHNQTDEIRPTANIRDYYRYTLDSEEKAIVVESLALFPKIGFKNEVRPELEFISKMTGIDIVKFESIANLLHDSPGFIGRGGRFFYVTPYIIAKLAFDNAWKKWVSNNAEGFMNSLPEDLKPAFFDQLKQHGDRDAKALVADKLRVNLENIDPKKLASRSVMKTIEAIVESNPNNYLQILISELKKASSDDIKSIKGEYETDGWGARRILVWLLERLAAFKEHFYDCEKGLFILALNESENDIGNNSTKLWCNLFKISNSGTELPFHTRLTLLKDRLESSQEQEIQLVLKAFESPLNDSGFRVLGSPVVSGRIVPDSWKPNSSDEYNECMSKYMDIVVSSCRSENILIKKSSVSMVLSYLRTLLNYKYLNQLKEIFNTKLDDITISSLNNSIKDFIYYDSPRFEGDEGEQYIDQVLEWSDSIRSNDIHGAMVVVLMEPNWKHSLRDDEEWEKNIDDIAKALFQDKALFIKELPWICSTQTQSSRYLGERMGQMASDDGDLDKIFSTCLELNNFSFASGYVSGFLKNNANFIDTVNLMLDLKSEENPNFVYEVSLITGHILRSFDRAYDFVNNGKLTIQQLTPFAYGERFNELIDSDIIKVFNLCIDYIKKGYFAAFQVGDAYLHNKMHKKDSKEKKTFKSEELDSIIWDYLDKVELRLENDSGYWWGKTLDDLIIVDADRTVKIIVDGLVAKSFAIRDLSKKMLITYSPTQSKLILMHIYNLMITDKAKVTFSIDNYQNIFNKIDEKDFKIWLEKHDDIAVVIARHLPSPFIDKDGSAIVPANTLYFLDKYNDNDDVFWSFYVGRNSGKIYSGDIASEYKKQAEEAKLFSSHQSDSIRKWANKAYDDLMNQYEKWKGWSEELRF